MTELLDRMRAAGIDCGFDLSDRPIIIAGLEPSADSLRELAARLLAAANAIDASESCEITLAPVQKPAHTGRGGKPQ